MKQVFKEAINGGAFNLSDMLSRIDFHHIHGNLSDEEREELAAMAREKAAPMNGLDIGAKLLELDARVAALEKGGVSAPNVGGSISEYTAGKWYYTGDKVTHNGATYECIAPMGVACVWSPDEYPAYWERVEGGANNE